MEHLPKLLAQFLETAQAEGLDIADAITALQEMQASRRAIQPPSRVEVQPVAQEETRVPAEGPGIPGTLIAKQFYWGDDSKIEDCWRTLLRIQWSGRR